jgi:hypothetical protein
MDLNLGHIIAGLSVLIIASVVVSSKPTKVKVKVTLEQATKAHGE